MLSEGVEQDESSSSTCESESQRRDKTDAGESIRTGTLELMNRIELLKREKSIACFQEITDLLDQTNEDTEDHFQDVNYNSRTKQAHMKSRKQPNREGDCSKANFVGIEGSTDHIVRDFHDAEFLEMIDDANNADKPVNEVEENSIHEIFSPKEKNLSKFLAKNGILLPEPHSETREAKVSQEELKVLTHDLAGKMTRGNTISSLPGNLPDEEMSLNESLDSLKAIDEIMESRSSSYCHSSPPYYKKDILHRRQNLEEEFMQLSLDSYSLASSSDSETSEDDLYLSDSSCSMDCQTTFLLNTERDSKDSESDTLFEGIKEESDKSQQNSLVKDPSFVAHGWPDSNAIEESKMDHAMTSCTGEILENAVGGRLPQPVAEGMSQTMEKKGIRKKKRRVVLLDMGRALDGKSEQTGDSSSSLCISSGSVKNGMKQLVSKEDGFFKSEGNKLLVVNSLDRVKDLCTNCAETSDCNGDTVDVKLEDSIELYFHRQVADSRVSECCICYVFCNCVRLWEDDPREREVAVLLSSESKMYILMTSSGTVLNVLGSHRLQDISNILVGVGLQVLRVHIGRAASYLFLTRNIVKSRELLDMLEKCLLSTGGDSSEFILQSWELMQIKLFEKYALGGVRLNVILYTMLLFEKGSAWFARSLFLSADHIFLCVEDLVQFGLVSEEAVMIEPYFVLEAWSSISSILELVIEPNQCESVTLVFSDIMHGKFQFGMTRRDFLSNDGTEAYKDDPGHMVWKLKGFTEDTLLKFISLLRAVYMEATMHALPVKNIV